MAPFLEDIVKRPLNQRLGILFGSLLLIGLLLWANSYSPPYEEYKEMTTKIESLRADVAKEKKLALNLDQYKKEVRELDIRLEFALHELPDKSEIPELLASVSGLAKEAGLDVGLFRVNAERLDDFYARVPVEISVAGSFHQVLSFFDDVAHLSRVVNISQIEMLEPQVLNGFAGLKVNCIATTFRYLTPEEQSQSSQRQSEERKRR